MDQGDTHPNPIGFDEILSAPAGAVSHFSKGQVYIEIGRATMIQHSEPYEGCGRVAGPYALCHVGTLARSVPERGVKHL